MKEDLKIASVFIGTIVGAGLASGQEILQFFSLFGIKGFYGIIACCITYVLFSVIIVNLCFSHKYKSYKEIIFSVLGNKVGFIVDIILTLFIFGSNTIMISGGGAMLHEYANIDRSWGIFIMIIISFLAAVFSTKGVVAVNSIIVPLSTSSIVILGILVFISNSPGGMSMYLDNIKPVEKNWALSAALYSSFNLMGITGVLAPMISESKTKRQFINGSIIGTLILTLLALVINYSILLYSPQSFYNEIPNLFIAKHFGRLFPLFLTLIIWLEMFSTEVGNLYSLTKRVEYSFNIPYITSLLIIIFFSIPVSFIGFANLIKLLYPPYGAVSLIFLAGCLFKFFKKPNKKF